jgi:hypothetical protein
MSFKPIKKTENLDIFSNMLSIIPGLSITSAQKIKEKYNSMAILLDAYNKMDDIKDKYDMLSDIQLNNKRRLGNALSKKIYLAIFEDLSIFEDNKNQLKKEKGKKEDKNTCKKENKEQETEKEKETDNIICLID